jgi:hypothetical protein
VLSILCNGSTMVSQSGLPCPSTGCPGAAPLEEIIRETPPPTREHSPATEDTAVAPQREDPFALPASTAPALLQTNSRSKRARGQTLDYKAMYEDKQSRPKRGK